MNILYAVTPAALLLSACHRIYQEKGIVANNNNRRQNLEKRRGIMQLGEEL